MTLKPSGFVLKKTLIIMVLRMFFFFKTTSVQKSRSSLFFLKLFFSNLVYSISASINGISYKFIILFTRRSDTSSYTHYNIIHNLYGSIFDIVKYFMVFSVAHNYNCNIRCVFLILVLNSKR